MQIGSPSYKKCPHCEKKIEYYSEPFFVDYYGLTEWSDGETFEEMPSLKNTRLQKCQFCNQYYWFTRKLGGMSFEAYVEAAAHFEKEYSRKSLINFLFTSRNKRRLLYIRLNIFRRYNDQIRVHPLVKRDVYKKPIPVEKKNILTNNVKLLIDLVTDIKPDDYLLIAELYRTIGDFERAKNAINKLTDNGLKELISNEIEHKNCDVITIKQLLNEHLH